MDIYEDNVISSDEYDDNDDLMNFAVTKTEEPRPTIAAMAEKNDTKPQKKIIRKLGLKLKKKSIKWMQQKFQRKQTRHRYLYCLARAKCINKHGSLNTMAGTSTSTERQVANLDEPKKLTEENMPMKTIKNNSQHETIDLDDTDDDDDDEDEDDYDEDDDSSSNSSNIEDEVDDEEDNDNEKYEKDKRDVTFEDEQCDDVDDINMISMKNDIAEVVNDENKIEHNKTDNQIAITEQHVEKDIPKPVNEMPAASLVVDNMRAQQQIVNPVGKEQTTLIENNAVTVSIPPQEIKIQINNQTASLLDSSEDPTLCNTNKTIENNNKTVNNSKDNETLNISKDLGIQQSFFFNDELNAMYSSFDKIVNEHVTFPETAEIIKERIKLITADVEHINKALEIKERECNQLLYVKHTKEQILARLLRKIKRNEVNTDQNTIEAIACRELGLIPKQSTRVKEPPLKKRKFEPRTAQEIIEHGANMTLDEALRVRAQNHLDVKHFIDDTLKKFAINTPKQNVAKRKPNPNLKINQSNQEFYDINQKFTLPQKRSYQEMRSSTLNVPFDSQAGPSIHRNHHQQHHEQNLLLSLLSADNDSNDNDAATNFKTHNVDHHEATLEKLLNNWAGGQGRRQPAQRMQQHNEYDKDDDDAYEVIIEKKPPSRNGTSQFPILNHSSQKTPMPNSDETLVVHLDVSDFKDNTLTTTTQKYQTKNVNNFICQYCGVHKAQYVCAECENQWYCSRSCQVKAWDSHSETCE